MKCFNPKCDQDAMYTSANLCYCPTHFHSVMMAMGISQVCDICGMDDVDGGHYKIPGSNKTTCRECTKQLSLIKK